ncbi:hypothetical protein [Peribacillus sp. SCS-155]|uniref:hypothetical protein n=1 Tax=Peribacillus sedimenti TaxID=3115297 RepID=UPI003905D89E
MVDEILSQLTDFLDHAVTGMILLIIACAVVYSVVFLIMRSIDIPRPISSFVATLALIAAAYYAFKIGYIPNVIGN